MIIQSLFHLGGHGAAMTNMIFAPADATVIEFSMRPQCSRFFGYMAMSLGLDYWLVPQVHSFYHLNYVIDESGVAAVVRLLDHILDRNHSSESTNAPNLISDDETSEVWLIILKRGA
jgi:hypothetical protein